MSLVKHTHRYPLLVVLALIGALLNSAANAQMPPLKPLPDVLRSQVTAPQVNAKSWMLMDYASGWMLYSENVETRLEPASLTKLMTSFVVFEALSQGRISEEDSVFVSEKAWRTGGSKMFLNIGDNVTVGQLLRGLIVQSGNDAAVALAEHVAGDEASFASLMNDAAAMLGMQNTNFVNASGLPDEAHYSTTYDLMILARAIIHRFPNYFPLYSQQEYSYAGITQKNRNLLLYRDPDADGLKTGYTEKAGYVLIGTMNKQGHRLMAIVTGTESKNARADEVQKLLNYGFRSYQFKTFFTPEQKVASVPMLFGDKPDADVAPAYELGVIFPRGQGGNLSASLALPDYLEAPLLDRQRVGTITVRFEQQDVMQQQLEVLGEQQSGPWYSRLWDWIKRFFM